MFACKWYRNRELTWSGTAWALYKGLQDFFEIEDFEMKESIFQKIARRVRHDNNYGMEKVNRKNQKIFGTYGKLCLSRFEYKLSSISKSKRSRYLCSK